MLRIGTLLKVFVQAGFPHEPKERVHANSKAQTQTYQQILIGLILLDQRLYIWFMVAVYVFVCSKWDVVQFASFCNVRILVEFGS